MVSFYYALATCLLILDIVNSKSFSISQSKHFSQNRTKRESSKCSLSEFECDSGQCISRFVLCDGIADCSDSSDETLGCKERKCPTYAFVCKYGACANGYARCNNITECVDNSDEENCGWNTPNVKNQSDQTKKCKTNNFQCNNGQCIQSYFLCDGKSDCEDGSDETEKFCSEKSCMSFLYRCDYGACTDGDARCNGVQNCADGSDERNCPVTGTSPKPTPTQAATPTGCTLPQYPTHGYYNITGRISKNPGESVVVGTQITYFCKKGYTLSQTDNFQFCANDDDWLPKRRYECIATCPPLVSKSVHIVCKLGEVTKECSKPLLPGTKAFLSCETLYENPVPPRFDALICSDGSWDYSLSSFICVPVCGKKRIASGVEKPLVILGENAIHGEYPWQVGIYKRDGNNYQHICGGALLNPKVILSAAHCVTDLSNGKLLPIINYLIASGKYFRELYHPNDNSTEQRSNVSKIYVPTRYVGRQRSYADDIAVIVTQITFTLTEYVQPVCLDLTNVLTDSFLLRRNMPGIVLGWGLTEENGDPADFLKILRVPFVSFDQCLNNLPEDFIPFLTDKKMCAGYLNGSAVCNGDSGGSLSFEYNDKYYVKGVVSLAPGLGSSCHSKQYSTYTIVNEYIDWIRDLEVSNRN